jgi:hypothetical protein
VHQQQGLALLTAMRSVHLLLLAAAACTAVLAVVAIDILRLLPLKSAIDVALLATTAALAISHCSTPSSAIHWRTTKERFGAPAVSETGRFASDQRPAVPPARSR